MLEMKEDLIEGVGMVEAKELAIHDEWRPKGLPTFMPKWQQLGYMYQGFQLDFE
jgi:hypothetical protein